MKETDREYFRERAEAELARAREAKTPEAQRAHSLLAGYYFDRAFRGAVKAASRPPLEAAPPILNEIRV